MSKDACRRGVCVWQGCAQGSQEHSGGWEAGDTNVQRSFLLLLSASPCQMRNGQRAAEPVCSSSWAGAFHKVGGAVGGEEGKRNNLERGRVKGGGRYKESVALSFLRPVCVGGCTLFSH